MINNTQIKMARAGLNWGVRDLADKSGVNFNTVSRFENGKSIQTANLAKIEQALTAAGVEFLDDNGVRIKKDHTVNL